MERRHTSHPGRHPCSCLVLTPTSMLQSWQLIWGYQIVSSGKGTEMQLQCTDPCCQAVPGRASSECQGRGVKLAKRALIAPPAVGNLRLTDFLSSAS